MSGESFAYPKREPDRPKIPGYEIGELLGRGAMGTVWRARQLAVDREVALKVLHPELAHQNRLVRRLQREARTTARLAHPHVVSAIDMGQAAGTWWYAMEFVDGPSLAERLRAEGRLKEREALRLFIPLCEALEHLVEHGVVHRDIKPGNILIDRAGGARLADLGLAFADDDPSLTRPGGTLGTPHYISPEQAVDPTGADVKSDIWSFGATLFHTVCGRPPFAGESAAEILSAVLYSRVPEPRELEPSLSKGLSLVLRKCLTREPEGRYQTPRELLLDLERVRERRLPKVRRSRLDPVARESGAHLRWAGIAVLCLLVLGAGLWLAKPFDDERSELPALETPLPYLPLEQVLRRVQDAPRELASARRELDDLRLEIPPVHQARWQDIERELASQLRARVGMLRREVATEIERELEEREFAAADATFRFELPVRLLEQTGYRLEALEEQGIPMRPWLEGLEERIAEAAGAAASELQEALSDWSRGRREEADRLLESQEWERALALLDQGPEAILSAAGFADLRLPQALREEAVGMVQTELLLKRREVEQEWEVLDHDLSRKILTRKETLQEELERSRPRPRAAADLETFFILELEQRRLSRDNVPSALPVTCFSTLERAREELLEREEQLLEDDARLEFEEAERLSKHYYESRRYADARPLWEELQTRLGDLAARAAVPWRDELERNVARRREEAVLLEDLLERAARGIRGKNGAAIDLRVGSVTYTKVVVVAPNDPLKQGFQLEGIQGAFKVQDLPSSEIEILAGLAQAELSPRERLALAVFRFYEGRFEDARAAMRSGPLPAEGLLGEIEPDLLNRVFESVEKQRSLDTEREAVAESHLDLVLDPGFQERAPSSVLARIDLLLDQYSDLSAVRSRLDELRALREALRAVPKPPIEELLRTRFSPSAIETPSFGRVELGFDFKAQAVGAWQPRDWVFDGAGWTLASPMESWEDLRRQRGPQLVLEAPLDPDRDFELEIELEAADDGPNKLLLVSAAGFHVALCGNGLPGSRLRAHYLAGTDDLETFLRLLENGEGRVEDGLFAVGKAHRLRLRAYRPTGHLRIEFDGRTLRELRGPPAREEQRSIEIRSWERLRLTSATLETGL